MVRNDQNGSNWSKKHVLLLFLRIEWFWVKSKSNFFSDFRIFFGFSGSLFRWFFGPFWPPGAKLRFFRNRWFSPVVSLYRPLTFDRKPETSHDPILRKLRKTSKNHIWRENVSGMAKMGQNGPKNMFYCFFCELNDFE